ncbi:histidine kinase [Phycicoccus jejuensis]|uniref:sensor histidine kinase n=1 Tax=Phycicoccus jejuensis TaxID=367299 RepID=UPI0038508169
MDRVRGWVRDTVSPWDAALAVGLATAAGLDTLRTSAPHPGARAVLATLVVLALLVRVRHPIAACTWAACVLLAESLLLESPDEVAVLVALVVLSYSAYAHAPARRAGRGAAVVAAAASVSVAVDPSDSLSNLPATLVFFVVVPAALGWSVRRRARTIDVLEVQREALTRELGAVAAEERARIARDLHDVVAHAVTLIAVQAEAGSARLPRDTEGAARSLEAIAAASREALAELHRLLGLLDDVPVAAVGLAGLPGLVEGARAAGLEVRVTTEGTVPVLDPEVDRCALRVVQEAVTNALRHADQPVVDVVVRHHGGTAHVSVASRGARPRLSSYGGSGRGLVGLRARVEALGGQFSAGPVDDRFVVRADLPARARAVAS